MASVKPSPATAAILRRLSARGKRFIRSWDLPKLRDGTCRWCGGTLQGRQRWCSKACEDEFEIRAGFHIRMKVRARDKCVCSKCGIDCRILTRARMEIAEVKRSVFGISGLYPRHAPSKILDQWGPYYASKHVWEAHHEVPVAGGGGVCGLEGYVTLCLPCHRKTKHMRRKKC